MTGEMSLEERLINRDRFDADTFGFRFEADNAIDHEKWETMRQNLHYLIGIESSIAARHRTRRCHGAPARLLPRDCASQLRIYSVTGFHSHDMTVNTPSDQSEVADHIEDFGAHEFVRKPQRFLAQHRFAAHNDCVFQAAALDEIF